MDFLSSAKRVIDIEGRAIATLGGLLDNTFVNACEQIMACKGKVVVSGMGKSGHIGRKIAATLASTGTPAFFMHPGEANHGDLGMLSRDDVLFAISNSGETSELLNLLPVVKRMAVPIIALTQQPRSHLAQHADIVLAIGDVEEACSLGLAPTSSTTATLVLGDALAIALLDAKGFTSHDFALSHPGGSLGRKLLLTVADVMQKDAMVPIVNGNCLITDALMEITRKGIGMTSVVDNNGKMIGVFTDGDLRRLLDARIDIHGTAVADVMTPGGKAVTPQLLAVEALNLMESSKISALMVVNEEHHPVGALNMHALLSAGVV